MKKQLLFLSLFISILLHSACSSDESNKNEECNCYYTLVEGGQLQEGYVEPSDTTDCNLDGIHVYFQDFSEGEPNDTYYRILHCQ